MRFSSVALAALAALPSAISAFSLYDISSDLGDANSKCASQYSIPLMSCGFLPGRCSEACQEQLRSLEKTLQNVCKDTKNPENLLLAALYNGLVPTLCQNAASETTSFQSGPGKTPTTSAVQLSFSGIVEVSSVGDAQSEPTGLVIDTSVPITGSQTIAIPENTYSPTTLRTTSAPASTTSSSGNSNSGSNGSPFSSQDDSPSSAAAIRVSALGLAAGIFALIANIA